MTGVTPGFLLPYPNYTDPANGPAQIKALAEAMDDAVLLDQTQINNALSRKNAGVSAVAVQAIPNAVYTAVQWVTEDFDTDNIFNLGVSNTNATPNTPGTYIVSALVRFAANAVGSRGIRIVVDGTPDQGTTTEVLTVGGGLQTTVQSVGLISLAPPSVVTVQVLQGSGGALNIDFRRFSLAQLST